MSVAACASRPTGPAAMDASAPILNWLLTRFSSPRWLLITRMMSADWPPIWRPNVPPINVRNAGDDQPFAPRALMMTDPFVGQLSFIRVYSGVLTSGDTVYT